MSKKSALNHYLLKSEPGTYSIDDLRRDGKTAWNGVRNFQARNHLRTVCAGDLALIYHSGDDKAVVGLAKCIRAAYPDPDPKKPGDWVQIDLQYVRHLERPVPLKELKAHPKLKTLPLITQSRLSSMPITSEHFEIITTLAAGKSR